MLIYIANLQSQERQSIQLKHEIKLAYDSHESRALFVPNAYCLLPTPTFLLLLPSSSVHTFPYYPRAPHHCPFHLLLSFPLPFNFPSALPFAVPRPCPSETRFHRLRRRRWMECLSNSKMTPILIESFPMDLFLSAASVLCSPVRVINLFV